jgi:hypothetical protein
MAPDRTAQKTQVIPHSPRSSRGLTWILAGCTALLCAALSGCGGGSGGGSGTGGKDTGGGPAPPPTLTDWTRFGWDAGRSSAPNVETGISAGNVASLTLQQVALDGTVDASAIYLHGAKIQGATHDVFFVTTTYGKTIAIDADSGTVLWEYTPSSYAALAGTYRITTATPVADPDRQSIYAASPDGMIRKLAVADGHVEWETSITKLPEREKIASSLNFDRGHVLATTGGYIGDAPPYQGHVAVLDAATGNLLAVWNSLCSDRAGLIDPASCAESDSAIWGRAGAVIDTATGNIYVATGNGLWDGLTNWGDATLELNASATQLLGNFTPVNTDQLNASDLDVGSTSPVLLGGGLVLQGGKDGTLRLLDWSVMQGTAGHKGNELQVTQTPGGDRLFTAPAVLRDATGVKVFVADNSGTQAWALSGIRLQSLWSNGHKGTSPVVADGLLYVYDPGGGLRVYDATTGNAVTTLACGGGHWNSPIVVGGRVALPEGNANDHRTSGLLNIWRVR